METKSCTEHNYELAARNSLSGDCSRHFNQLASGFCLFSLPDELRLYVSGRNNDDVLCNTDRRGWCSDYMYLVGTVMMSCVIQTGGAGALTICTW